MCNKKEQRNSLAPALASALLCLFFQHVQQSKASPLTKSGAAARNASPFLTHPLARADNGHRLLLHVGPGAGKVSPLRRPSYRWICAFSQTWSPSKPPVILVSARARGTTHSVQATPKGWRRDEGRIRGIVRLDQDHQVKEHKLCKLTCLTFPKIFLLLSVGIFSLI